MTAASRQTFLTEIRLRVQTYDIDFAGIVSNIVYIRWLEDLRLKMLEDHWPLDRQMAEGYLPVLLTTNITYRRALRLFEAPVGRMWLPELGRARWTLEAEIALADGTIAASAVQTCAFVSSATLKPLPIPTTLRELFASEQRTAERPPSPHD